VSCAKVSWSQRAEPSGEQGLDLGGKGQHPVEAGVAQGFDAEAVAGGEQPLFPFIREQEGELTTQVVHALGTVFFVQVQDHLAVRVGAEAVAARLELRPDPLEVVKLAVDDDVQLPVLVL
jgi:hypothetical protein